MYPYRETSRMTLCFPWRRRRPKGLYRLFIQLAPILRCPKAFRFNRALAKAGSHQETHRGNTETDSKTTHDIIVELRIPSVWIDEYSYRIDLQTYKSEEARDQYQ